MSRMNLTEAMGIDDLRGKSRQQLMDIRLIDILDIGLVSVMLFFAFRFIRERRAGKLALGIVLLFLIMIISDALEMYVTRFFLQNIFQVSGKVYNCVTA